MKKINFLRLFSIIGLLTIIPILFVIRMLPAEPTYKTVKFPNAAIKAEVADTVPKQMEGLMSRKSLPDKEGMLFIFKEEGRHGIWMMNMSFPIDILWISKDYKIVDFAEDAQPCRFNCPVYMPDKKAMYVLEANSGFVSQNKLKSGDSVRIS